MSQRDINEGNTPLHIAAEAGRMSVVRLLLKNGADPLQENKFLRIPADIAVKSNIRKLLLIKAEEQGEINVKSLPTNTADTMTSNVVTNPTVSSQVVPALVPTVSMGPGGVFHPLPFVKLNRLLSIAEVSLVSRKNGEIVQIIFKDSVNVKEFQGALKELNINHSDPDRQKFPREAEYFDDKYVIALTNVEYNKVKDDSGDAYAKLVSSKQNMIENSSSSSSLQTGSKFM